MKSLIVSLAGLLVLGVTLASATQNSTPFVNQPLVPSAVAPGGAGFTLTVNGTGFVSGSTVNWNGSPRTTTFVNGSQVRASILGSDIATAATASVTVVSPAPGGGASNVVFLPVREPQTFVSMNSSSLDTQGNANTLVAADFNADGRQDLAVIGYSGAYELEILLGNGDGTFRAGDQYALSGNPNSILSADVNGDGYLDLIVTNMEDLQNQTSALGVLLGNGDGTFQQPIFSDGFPCCRAVSGDFNRDGAIDVALIDGNSLCVFLGNGNGTFRPLPCGGIPGNFSNIAVGDFNADGRLDVALSGSNNDPTGLLVIMLGGGDGTFQAFQTYSIAETVFGVTTADFNGDGKLDIAAVDEASNAVKLFRGRGDGTFLPPSSSVVSFEPFYVAVADMNGDGNVDLVTGGYGYGVAAISVLLGNGNATFQEYAPYDGGPLQNFALGDFNGDGKIDIAVTSGDTSGTITILTQDNGSVVTLSPGKLNFPLQLLGTVSNPKVINLTNTSTAPVTISDIGITPNFSQLNNCKTVQPGHTCKIGVYFTPTITGTITGYLAIADDGGGSPQLVSLFGSATIVSISPGRLDFGSWPVGHVSTSQKVVVTNEGNGSMNITEIGIVGPNGKDFSEVNACPGKLAAGASCTISVIFHPSAKGARSATLGIVDSGGGSPQKVPLTGTGT